MNRTYRDRCPGVFRPWIAEDGALVRLRLVGGGSTAGQLRQVLDVAEAHGDGTVLLTRRANLQLRGIAHEDGRVPQEVVDEVSAAGLLPSPEHELVRNIMTSPLTGLLNGRADLRPVAQRLDEAIRADDELAGLSARFLFVLDDGRGDVVHRDLDLGAMAVDAGHAQVRIGAHAWGEVVALDDLADVLASLARRFVELRGSGDDAPWHVDELDDPTALVGATFARDLRTGVTAMPLRYGTLGTDDGGTVDHVAVPDGVLTPDVAEDLLGDRGPASPVVVTPWRSLLLPEPAA
ncbi:MAG: nitrite reductase [Aeromicrobium erythreum]